MRKMGFGGENMSARAGDNRWERDCEEDGDWGARKMWPGCEENRAGV